VRDFAIRSEDRYAPYPVSQLIEVGGLLFFAAAEPDTGSELWRSDGTTEGTRLVADVLPGPDSGDPYLLTNWNGRVAFIAREANYVTHLWRSDGSSDGTRLIDVPAGGDWRNPFLLTSAGDALFFAAAGGYLWRTDGTTPGTARLPTLDLDPRYYLTPAVPREILPARDHVFVSVHYATECCQAAELLRSEPTESVSLAYFDWVHSLTSLQPEELTALGTRVLFRNPEGLWSDGERIWDRPDGGATADELTAVGQTVFFRSANELWKTDGTAAGTQFVRRFAEGPGGGPDGLTAADGAGLFFIADDGTHGRELWHARAATEPVLVRDIAPGAASSSPANLTPLGGVLAFTIELDGGGSQLWLSSGARTVRIQDLPGEMPRELTLSDYHLFFTLFTVETGRDLWAIPRAALSLDPRRPCPGDCDGDGIVHIEELMTGVAMALGTAFSAPCRAAYCNGDCGPGPAGRPLTVACLIRSVRSALHGCNTAPCDSDADCDDFNGCSQDACDGGVCTHQCLCA